MAVGMIVGRLLAVRLGNLAVPTAICKSGLS